MKTAFLLGVLAPVVAEVTSRTWIILAVMAAVGAWWAWPKLKPLLSRLVPASNPEGEVSHLGESECVAAIRVLMKHGHDRAACEKLWMEVFAKEFVST